MRELGGATEHDMILAFIRAEIDSVRFGDHYRHAMSQRGWSREHLIEHADLTDASANSARMQLLRDLRGYGANSLLFRGFPNDAQWRRVEITKEDINRLVYANHPTWLALSAGSRRVIDGARNVHGAATDVKSHILAVTGLVAGGARFAELIAVEGRDRTLILMEGHTRATAYALAAAVGPIEVLVASSARMFEWAFY